MGIKKFIDRIVNEIIDKRMDSERESARREAKKVRRYEYLESLGLRRLRSNSLKRKVDLKSDCKAENRIENE